MAKYQSQGSQIPQKGNLNWLVTKHVDRMSMGITGFSPEQSNLDRITSYYLQIQHLENLLTTSLAKPYLAEKQKLGIKEAKGKLMHRDNIPGLLEFSERISKWLQILLTCAQNQELITGKVKVPHAKSVFEEE